MRKQLTILLAFKIGGVLFFIASTLQGQELFPVNEPASTMPKGVTGIRITSHLHYKYRTIGHREMVRLLYGAGSRLTLMATVSTSNFHVNTFPQDLNSYFNNYHDHKATANVYPNRFEGAHVYGKFRVVTRDEKNKHFRIALYGEASASKSIHLDAFPNLQGDNSGVGSGLIFTTLNKRFAASLTGGYLWFLSNTVNDNNERVVFQAGDAIAANGSFGYLVYPRVYKSYRDLNVNVYLEVNSRFYDDPVVSRDGQYLNTGQFKYLRRGSLSYVYPGLQLIINSTTRLDFVYEQPLHSSNRLERFPMLIVNVQRYFF